MLDFLLSLSAAMGNVVGRIQRGPRWDIVVGAAPVGPAAKPRGKRDDFMAGRKSEKMSPKSK